MSGAAPSPVPVPSELRVRPGPALLSDVAAGPSLAAHRRWYGALPQVSLADLCKAADRLRMRGRGGAGFPFAVKLRTAAKGRRPVVVVNLGEGEPASAKDTALALTRPHLVLDGAAATARALGARELHIVLPGERPAVVAAVEEAVRERADGVVVHTHIASPRFVAGQARAVLELMAGRPNLPVTAWDPEAVSGHRGRPTLLSNAETWAQVGRLVLVGPEGYCEHGTAHDPGTTLLTLTDGGPVPEVVEVAFGTRLRSALPSRFLGRPAMVGGFHGAWASWETLASARVSVDGMRSLGIPLGAGLVLSAPECPVRLTARVVDYLAGQSAGRCGPCLNGLPALSEAFRAVESGRGDVARVRELTGLVTGRGACAHPDGTARLVRSLLASYADEVAEHSAGSCGWDVGGGALRGQRLEAVVAS